MKKDIYNIKINPSQPSSDEIAKHKDFDALLQQFQETEPEVVVKPHSKLRWLRYASAAAAVLLLAFFVRGLLEKSTVQTEQEYFAEQPFINPPLENIKPTFASRSVNANQGGIYEYDNGTKLIVPAAAFTDNNGKLVEGDVDIKFREMHDFVDFFLSGIPMTYDSAGTQYTLESAGMVEIYAEQNGKRLQVQSDKAIQVELVSYINMPRMNQSPRYNIYKLDVANRNWEFKDIDNIQIIEDENIDDTPENEVLAGFENELKKALKDIEDRNANALLSIENAQPLPIQPLRPQRAISSDIVVDFDIVDNTTPELQEMKAQYGSMLWKVSDKNVNFNSNALNVEWEDAKINKLNTQDYELTLINGSNQLKIIVNPALTGDDYNNALTDYNSSMVVYNQELAQRDASLQPSREEVNSSFLLEKMKAQQEYDAKIAAWKKEKQDDPAMKEMVRRKIINRFVATSFGVWNCDRPIHPDDLKVNGKFTNDQHIEFDKQTAYLVDKNRNTIVKMHAKEGAQVNFDKDSDNMLWMVTKNGQIAIFKPEEFKRINQKKGNHNFMLEVQDQALKTEEDVREVLKFKEM